MESKDRNPGKSENLFRSSFFRKLFLSYVLLILVSMAVFSAWYLYSYNVNQRTAIRENARQQATVFATRTDQNLLIAQSLAGAMNSSEILRSMYQAVCIEKKDAGFPAALSLPVRTQPGEGVLGQPGSVRDSARV